MRSTGALLRLCLLLSAPGASLVLGLEPRYASQFQYDEQLLEKMIRMEDEMDKWEARMNEKLALITRVQEQVNQLTESLSMTYANLTDLQFRSDTRLQQFIEYFKSEITCAYLKPVPHALMSYSGLGLGNSVTFTCEPGYTMVSGDAVRTCHENGGWAGTQPKCRVQNCVTLQNNAAGKLKSGLYQINRGGRNFHIYCNYGNGDGYVYVSPSVPSDMDLNMASLSDDSSLVKVIHMRQNGRQYEATIQQITAFNTLPVSVQVNKNDGYQGVVNTAMGPYVFTGFVPLSHNVRNGVQGWKVNGKEITFTNGDGNPNSYFAVLFNANKTGYTSYKGWKNGLMYAWYDLATLVPVSDSLPEAMFSPHYEIHHGGGGGYSIGTTESDITGVTIGQRFIITCSEPDDVRDATKTFSGVKPGSVVTYICNTGYKSSGDLVRNCTPTGGWSGVQPTCTR